MKIRTILFLAFNGICCMANAQKKVTLDYYFNHEVHTTKAGTIERYHYLWTDKANTGFSILGEAFIKAGGVLDTLDKAPTVKKLKGSAVYIIVDPDTKKENANPNYIMPGNVVQISAWVKT